MLKIHNSLTREKQDFVPIEPGKVRMYVCGLTVQDVPHLGHARTFIAFDLIQHWLRASGFDVIYVRNITDIDDKIIRRAGENGETIYALTDRMIAAMQADFSALGLQAPQHEPRATEYVPQMHEIIAALEQKGLAYQAGARSTAMASCPASRLTICVPVSGWRSTRRSVIPWILCCGSQPRTPSLPRASGIRPGGQGAPVGISSARPWPAAFLARPLIFMVAGPT